MAIIGGGLIEEDESNILLMITLKENNPKTRSIRMLQQLIKEREESKPRHSDEAETRESSGEKEE